jgi:uncharacterized protein (DUF2062 family)
MSRRSPTGGLGALRRTLRYRRVIPVMRSAHTPEYTARGVAIGVLWGLTPLLGLQTLLMIVSCQISKRVFHKDASLLQAFIWSFVNNPATILPMYYAFYVTGLWMSGSPRSVGYDGFVDLWQRAAAEPAFVARVSMLVEHLGTALLIGCVPYALVASAVAYRWALAIAHARQHRLRRVRASGAERS